MSIEPETIGSTTLVVEDLEKSREFFEEKLGLIQIPGEDDIVKYDLGNSELVLFPQPEDVIQTSFSQPDAADLCINSKIDINKITTLLGTKGIILLKGPVRTVVGERTYQSVFLRDPDDHLIEIRSDNYVDIDPLDKRPEKGMSSNLDKDWIETK